ncbi:hypothetical protein ACT3UQ_04830 [Glutamicibacter sp. AOP12-B1-11]|uniref:hypothetical protein n=1 Tax=Micrococcaceae TaxID=1268 RepID=UPI0015E3EA5A|nr:hypothetical protein [Arthrobacter sp. MYb221]
MPTLGGGLSSLVGVLGHLPFEIKQIFSPASGSVAFAREITRRRGDTSSSGFC